MIQRKMNAGMSAVMFLYGGRIYIEVAEGHSLRRSANE